MMPNQPRLIPAPINKDQKRPLTKREKRVAETLRQIWDRSCDESGKKLRQKEAAAAMKISQPMVSHYLNGHTPAGLEAILKWAKFLDVRPTDIDYDFEFETLAPGDLSPEAIKIAIDWMSLPSELRNTIKYLIAKILNKP